MVDTEITVTQAEWAQMQPPLLESDYCSPQQYGYEWEEYHILVTLDPKEVIFTDAETQEVLTVEVTISG